jgi:surfeit locus 1 family protein
MNKRIIPLLMFVVMEITLISLGVWQLQRKAWKEELLHVYKMNATNPEYLVGLSDTPLDAKGKFTDTQMRYFNSVQFRKIDSGCSPEVVDGAIKISGQNLSGESGWRTIVQCASWNKSVLIDIGWAKDFQQPRNLSAAISHLKGWYKSDIIMDDPQALPIAGTVINSPAAIKAAKQLWPDKIFQPLLIIAQPQGGELQQSKVPGPKDIPNNHFAYAMQWFIFAGVLAVIFTIWQRQQRLAPAAPDA